MWNLGQIFYSGATGPSTDYCAGFISRHAHSPHSEPHTTIFCQVPTGAPRTQQPANRQHPGRCDCYPMIEALAALMFLSPVTEGTDWPPRGSFKRGRQCQEKLRHLHGGRLVCNRSNEVRRQAQRPQCSVASPFAYGVATSHPPTHRTNLCQAVAASHDAGPEAKPNLPVSVSALPPFFPPACISFPDGFRV